MLDTDIKQKESGHCDTRDESYRWKRFKYITKRNGAGKRGLKGIFSITKLDRHLVELQEVLVAIDQSKRRYFRCKHINKLLPKYVPGKMSSYLVMLRYCGVIDKREKQTKQGTLTYIRDFENVDTAMETIQTWITQHG